MKINIIRGILFLLLVIIFCIIFGFSNQNSEESSDISRKMTEILISNIKSIQKQPKLEKEKVLSRIEKVIRKIAHFLLYTLVGIILMILLNTYKIGEIAKFLTSLIIGIIYATSDEIHQFFIPGRSAQITDVIIDTIGVLFGTLSIMFILKFINLVIKKQKDNISNIEIDK